MSELIESLLGLPHFSLTDVSDLAEEYCGDFVRRDELEAILAHQEAEPFREPTLDEVRGVGPNLLDFDFAKIVQQEAEPSK